MKYYRLTENMELLEKWYLGEINDLLYIKQWGFTMKSLFHIDEDLEIPISINGNNTDFTENLTYNVPVISDRFKNLIEQYNVSLSKVKLKSVNMNKYGDYYALGVQIIDCVDEKNQVILNIQKMILLDRIKQETISVLIN